jgi:uncharacterized protein
MSSLRKRLNHPGTYLGLLALAAGLVVVDGYRPPDKQVAARLYVAAVERYQQVGFRTLGGRVLCRYSPTCSHYSVEAVERYGLGKGLRMTVVRVWRCRANVALGTNDPVP